MAFGELLFSLDCSHRAYGRQKMPFISPHYVANVKSSRRADITDNTWQTSSKNKNQKNPAKKQLVNLKRFFSCVLSRSYPFREKNLEKTGVFVNALIECGLAAHRVGTGDVLK